MITVPDRGFALRKRKFKKKSKAVPKLKITLPDGRTMEVSGEDAIQKVLDYVERLVGS